MVEIGKTKRETEKNHYILPSELYAITSDELIKNLTGKQPAKNVRVFLKYSPEDVNSLIQRFKEN